MVSSASVEYVVISKVELEIVTGEVENHVIKKQLSQRSLRESHVNLLNDVSASI